MSDKLLSLRIDDLSIGYVRHPVAAHLSATITPGMLTCLLGVNGAGKSTLLRTLSGLQPPLGGRVLLHPMRSSSSPTVEYEGVVDVTTMSRRQRARCIAVVLTEHPDVAQLTVREVVAMGRMPYTGFFGGLSAEDKAVVDKALEQVGIAGYASRDIQTLSDGERQKVMIAKALAQQTPVILLDEPTAFLDYPSKVEMMKLLHRLAVSSGLTILLSTHDIHLAEAFADRYLILDTTLHAISRAALHEYIEEAKR